MTERDLDIDLTPPILIDHELSELIAQRAADNAKKQRVRVFVGLFIGMLIGFGGAVLHLPMLALIGIVLALGVAFGTYLLMDTTRLLRSGQTKLLEKRLSNAIYWNAQFLPFNYPMLSGCVQNYNALLLSQGRFGEFEAVTRFTWAFTERKLVTSGVPKNWIIANNLAVAMICQCRFEEALDLLKPMLEKAKNKHHRMFLLTNIAICQIRVEKYDDAVRSLQQIRTLTGNKPTSQVFFEWRFQFIEAKIAVHKQDFERAEFLIQSVEKLIAKSSEPPQTQAEVQATLGEIRAAQGRVQESELFYRNAIDMLLNSNNPNYFAVAWYHREFAKALKESNPAQAQELLAKAEQYREDHITQQTIALDKVKLRLQNNKFRVISDLTTDTPVKLIKG